MGRLSDSGRIADRRRMIGVALGVPTMGEALDFLERSAASADVVEIRLDLFEEPIDVATLVRRSPRPVIATNRPVREGGRSSQAETDRLDWLYAAADAGAALVDVEWDALTPPVSTRLRSAGAAVIVSRHAFDRMPPEIQTWARAFELLGADAIKVVGMARRATDIPLILGALEHARRPTIGIAMGPLGRASRILALRYNACLLTFAAPSGSPGTAPGQLRVDELEHTYFARQIGSRTAVYVVAGPNADDRVVREVNARLRARGNDAVAVPLATDEPLGPIIAAFRSVPVDGWLLTSPVPSAKLQIVVDDFGERALRAGHVTVIARHGAQLVADDVAPGHLAALDFWKDSSTSSGAASPMIESTTS